jgi:hypothetical protein
MRRYPRDEHNPLFTFSCGEGFKKKKKAGGESSIREANNLASRVVRREHTTGGTASQSVYCYYCYYFGFI